MAPPISTTFFNHFVDDDVIDTYIHVVLSCLEGKPRTDGWTDMTKLLGFPDVNYVTVITI